MKTVSIDIGGTFTDTFVVDGERSAMGKAPTTRHNIAFGVLSSIADACTKLGFDDKAELIADLDLLRYATTISLNTLIQRTGPRVGVITTVGFEDALNMGRARQWVDGRSLEEVRNQARAQKPEPIVPRQLVVGVHERVNAAGDVMMPLSRQDVEHAVQRLVDRGAQAFVVALLNSHINAQHEHEIADIIDEHYPEAYLGSAPVILSSELSPTSGEYPRTNTAVLSAYLQRELAEELGTLSDELREAGYRGPILAVNAGGGAASIARTSAISTFGSGPVAGLFGAGAVCDHYGISLAVATDMGGTSFDLGIIRDGRPRYYEMRPVVENWLVRTPTLEVQTMGAGGGSIVRVDEHSKRIHVGPQSAGSSPGPACYNLGGTEATVTDADLVLGFLDAERFLGGRMPLDPDLAHQAVERAGSRLGLGTLEMADAIRRIADGNMAAAMYKELNLKGIDPRNATVLSYGGAGPTHAVGYSEPLGAKQIMVLPQSPVFCAFGAGVMDVSQIYVQSLRALLVNGQGDLMEDGRSALDAIVAELRERAERDFRAEGFALDQLQYSISVEMKYGGQIFSVHTESPVDRFDTEEAARALSVAFEERYASLYSRMSAFPAGGMEVETVQLHATIPVAKPTFVSEPVRDTEAAEAQVATRLISWDGQGRRETAIFDHNAVEPGMRIEGPAVVEADNTTIVVPEDWSLAFDTHRTGLLTPSSENVQDMALQGAAAEEAR